MTANSYTNERDNSFEFKPSEMAEWLDFCIANNENLLIVGDSGIGKTDLVEQASIKANAECLIWHPVVDDPTDYKGLPFPSKDGNFAIFLPFGNLQTLMSCDTKTVCFFDDFGQSTPAVQAAIMQLIWGGRINGHKVSDNITFIAATNRKQDRAAVREILKPVKRRFNIQTLKVDKLDWIKWAQKADMPKELIAFIHFQDHFLLSQEDSQEIKNTASPRTIAAAGRKIKKGIPLHLMQKAIAGDAGEAFAISFCEFLNIFKDLPTLDEIKKQPNKAPIPDKVDAKYAMVCTLAQNMNENNIDSFCKYLKRMPPEFSVASISMAITDKPALKETAAYIEWAAAYSKQLIA